MNRLQDHRRLLVVVLLLVIFVGVAFSQIRLKKPQRDTRKQVSLIVYGDDSERWENLRQGASLVCEQKNAGLVLLTMLSEDDVNEQKEIIEREIEDGTDALIIAPCNSSEIRDFIESKKLRIPVVFLEAAETGDEEIKCITPDDYKMGYELGEIIVENESDIVTVAVISDNGNRDSLTLREKGLMDAIEGKVGKTLHWSKDGYGYKANKRMFIQKALVSEATDVIVAFDNYTTDALLDALTNLNEQRKVYSISTSDKAVYNLYSKEIIALEFPDEYAMGYIAAMNVLDRSYAKKMYSDKEIDYRIVKRENMYDEDNQTLLFPFVN